MSLEEIKLIRKDIELGNMGINSLCRSIELLMPKYYRYLKLLTSNEFKRAQLTHIILDHWQEFPGISDIQTQKPRAKTYFRTFIKLLEDRGVEQDKYFVWREDQILETGNDYVPDRVQKILDEDEKKEKFNEDAIVPRTPTKIVTGTMVCNPHTFEMQVFDGTNWHKVS
jgi:hypothetical protein